MSVVFIPTRGREWLLEAKVLPKWEAQDNVEEVVLVVERPERTAYKRVANPYPWVSVVALPKTDRGINYSRNHIVKLSDQWGLDQIIMADDDIYPRPDSDVERLFEWEGLECLGIGIMLPFYGLMFGNQTIKDEDRPLMSLGALGKRLFSLDVKKTMQVGNFDVRLHSGWGDDELVRDGMYREEATWYVHAGVHGVSVAGRYTKGGLNALHDEDQDRRVHGQEHSHQIIYEKWGPPYISAPGKRMMCKWKVFMDDFVTDWQSRIDWKKT